MQSLEDRIENKLAEIDKMFVVNPIEEKTRPLLSSGMSQMAKIDQVPEDPPQGQALDKKLDIKRPPRKPAQLTPYQLKLKEAEERKQKRQENAKAYLARGSSHNL